MKSYVRENIYIPYSKSKWKQAQKLYIHKFTVKSGTTNQEDEEQIVSLTRKVKIKGKTYISLPAGDLNKIADIFSIESLIDKRSDVDAKYKIKWTGKLRDGSKDKNGFDTVDQKQIVKDWLKVKYGIIESPARSGKSYIATCIACKLQKRILIISHQEELLKTYLDSFHDATNLSDIEERKGKKIIGIVKKMSDFKKYDICLVNYQKFIRETGEERVIENIRGKFGLAILEEVHRAGALGFANFIKKIDTRYKLGLSATNERKDGKYVLVEDIWGPVTVKARTVALLPKVKLVETGIKPKRTYKSYPYAMKFLFTNEERNKLIVKNVFKDLRKGHKVVVVPCLYKNHMFEIVRMINKQAKFNRINKGEDWPELTAVPFHAGVKDRDQLIKDVDKKKFKVLVPIRSMIQEGVTFRDPSSIHIIVPMSGGDTQKVGAPAFQQLINRVCTPDKKKKTPEVKIYIDNMIQSVGCFRTLFNKEIVPRAKVSNLGNAKYLLGKKTYKRATEIAATNTQNYSFKNKKIGKW